MPESSIISFRGRDFNDDDVAHIIRTIKLYPKLPRSELSHTLCEHFKWQTPSGTNKRRSCEALLERLEAQGLISLPSKRHSMSVKRKPQIITDNSKPGKVVVGSLKEIGPISLKVINESQQKTLWNEYIARYHYLGFKHHAGRTLRYFIMADDILLGCILISGASQGIAAREQWIGWTKQQRIKNLAWVVNNTRYLIFPWVKVPHLASHVLGKLVRQLPQDYEERWGYRPILIETFVDAKLYAGTCYKASNWQYLGLTRGVGVMRSTDYTTSPKMIFVYPLIKNACQLLATNTLEANINEEEL